MTVELTIGQLGIVSAVPRAVGRRKDPGTSRDTLPDIAVETSTDAHTGYVAERNIAKRVSEPTLVPTLTVVVLEKDNTEVRSRLG